MISSVNPDWNDLAELWFATISRTALSPSPSATLRVNSANGLGMTSLPPYRRTAPPSRPSPNRTIGYFRVQFCAPPTLRQAWWRGKAYFEGEPPLTASNAESRKQVVALYESLLQAWNRRDADGFAALFTEAGSSVGFDGSQLNGREEIAKSLSDIFASHQTATYVAKVQEIRPLGSEVTLVRAVVGMVPPGKSELTPAVNAVQSLMIIMRSSQPKIALLHNTPAAFHGRPDLGEQLTRELSAVLHTGKIVEAS
jgi:uncharacterized protein (TIGR02246 family)